MAAKNYNLKSSNLKSMTYDPKEQELHVTFHNGSTYKYVGVAPKIAWALRRNKSAGKTFNKRVRMGGFQYEKVGFVHGFLDGLKKEAVDTGVLRERMAKAWRGRHLRLPTRVGDDPGIGASMGPAATVHPAMGTGPGEEVPDEMKAMRGKLLTQKGVDLGSALASAVRQSREAAPSAAVWGIPEELKRVVARRTAVQTKALKGAPGSLGVEGIRALGDIGKAHEKFEVTTPKKAIIPGASHASPALVLSKEHNLLSRLTGPGSEEAVKTMRAVRGATDAPYFKSLLGRSFGPRAVEMYQKGEKIPRAMRTALARREPEHFGREIAAAIKKSNKVLKGI